MLPTIKKHSTRADRRQTVPLLYKNVDFITSFEDRIDYSRDPSDDAQ